MSQQAAEREMRVTEHDDEPIRGLPGHLPAGEYVLWQGAPSRSGFARRVLHSRKIAIYFAIVVAITSVYGALNGTPLPRLVLSGLFIALCGVVGIALFALYAYAVQRTTVYTLTNKRVVMKIGVAVSINVNLPFSRIVNADFKRHKDGTGDISLKLEEGSPKLGWYTLWPHTRPWNVGSPQPTLRSVQDADTAAMILRDQLMATHGAGIAEGASPRRLQVSEPDADVGLPAGAQAA